MLHTGSFVLFFYPMNHQGLSFKPLNNFTGGKLLP
jgi:hypothetical protein